MRKPLITAALLLLAVMPLAAQNDPCFRFQMSVAPDAKLTSPAEYTLQWPSVAGASLYYIEERIQSAPPERALAKTYYVNAQTTSLTIRHESLTDITYSYTIRTVIGPDCTGYAQPVRILGDAFLRRAVRRGIIPVAGSTRGANGAVFKTYLRLEGPSLRGRIIFHAANRIASDDDPSIPYDTSMKSEWDDVVAAIGQSGIGSLSIVPADDDTPLLPHATVRLYNVASNGIFGANVELYPAVGFLDMHDPLQRIDVPAGGNFRVNVGARAILAGSARVFVLGADGSLKKTVDRAFAAGEVIFGSPEAIYGITLEPGDSLVATFTRAIVPFFTLTDNSTNDPFVYVQGVERPEILDQYTR